MSQLLSIASNYGATQYDTKIPSLGDAANVVEAFRLYHYGIDNYDGSGPPAANSIESHLISLKSIIDQKLSISSASTTYATFAYAVGAASSASANADTRALNYATSASANVNTRAIEYANSASAHVSTISTSTYLTISGTQTATNKTFTSPVINSGSANSLSIISASTMGDQNIEQFLIRNLYISTASPSAGNNGDIWIRYV